MNEKRASKLFDTSAANESKSAPQKSNSSSKIASASNSETPENPARRKGRPSKHKLNEDSKPASPATSGGKRKR